MRNRSPAGHVAVRGGSLQRRRRDGEGMLVLVLFALFITKLAGVG